MEKQRTVRRAFLVTFCPQTRVVADVPEDFGPACPQGRHGDVLDRIIAAARERMVAAAADYLNGDNADAVTEDTVMPYDETYDGRS